MGAEITIEQVGVALIIIVVLVIVGYVAKMAVRLGVIAIGVISVVYVLATPINMMSMEHAINWAKEKWRAVEEMAEKQRYKTTRHEESGYENLISKKGT